MGRAPRCDKVGLQKGPWTPEEDQKLVHYIQKHGHGSWRAVPIHAGLLRSGKSCRLRWTNYLRPDIKRGKFSVQEEQTIIHLHALLGNRWSAIATYLDKRTDNDIKNYWNTHLKKKLIKMGIDPVTHKPKLEKSEVQIRDCSAVTSHKTQWETARLEAEARLALESKLRNKLSACNTGSCLHYSSSFLLANNSFSSFSMNEMNKPTSTETLPTSNQLYPLLVSSPNETCSSISLQKSFKKRSSHIFSSFASNQLHGELLELEASSSFCSSSNHEYDYPLALDFKEFEQYPQQENPSSSSSVSEHYLHYEESCNFNLPQHESNSEHNLDYRNSNSSSQDDDYWTNILDMHGELS